MKALQLGAVPGRPDRGVAQGQEARVDGAADENDRQHRPASRADPRPGPERGVAPERPRLRLPDLVEQRPYRDQHRQRRRDHQRLGLRVLAAEQQRDEVEHGAGAEGDRHRELAPSHPPDDAEQDSARPAIAAARPVRWAPAGGVEAVVGRRPDPQRLDR